MTTTQRSELTPVLDHKGNQRYAKPGATRQGETRPMKRCGTCGHHVVFVQSKAGKWYLADCFEGANGGSYYRKDQPHYKTCGHKAEANRAVESPRYAADIAQARWDAVEAWDNEMAEAGITVTREMRQAKIDQIKAEIV